MEFLTPGHWLSWTRALGDLAPQLKWFFCSHSPHSWLPFRIVMGKHDGYSHS